MEATVVNRTIIRYVKAFSMLSDAECDALLLGVTERRLNANEVLFRQGDPGDSMVIVHHGALSVRARRPDGLDAEVAVVQGGEVLGEMCVVDPAPRSASVVATAPSMVCVLTRDEVLGLRERAPSVYSTVMGAIIRDIHRRFREVDARVSEIIGARVNKPTRPPPSTRPPGSMRPTADDDDAPGSTSMLRRFVDKLRSLA